MLRYGRVLKARQLVGVRGAGPAFDGLYYVKSVTHKLKRGEYKQSFTLVRNGLVSTFRGCQHESDQRSYDEVQDRVQKKYLRQVPRHGHQQRRPDAARPHPGDRARRLERACRPAGRMPCVPIAGMQMGVFSVPQIGAGVWIEFEQGDPDYPIWVGGFWGIAAEVPALALARRRRRARHRDADDAAERRSSISDVPGPDRRHHAEEHDRRDDHRQRHRHHIQNGKGASIVMVGPTVTINAGALVVT